MLGTNILRTNFTAASDYLAVGEVVSKIKIQFRCNRSRAAILHCVTTCRMITLLDDIFVSPCYGRAFVRHAGAYRLSIIAATRPPPVPGTAERCGKRFFVGGSVYPRAYLWNHMFSLHLIFYACYPYVQSWLGLFTWNKLTRCHLCMLPTNAWSWWLRLSLTALRYDSSGFINDAMFSHSDEV